MDGFVTVVGLVSGIAGIAALLLPAQGWRQRAIHVIYGVSIAVLASLALNYQSRIRTMSAIEKQAATFLRTSDFSDTATARGYILGCLSFLEKHKGTLPDTYMRASKLAEDSGVLVNQQEDGAARLYQGWSMIDTASAMRQLVRGIAGNEAAEK
jgi:hypothetical protein